MDKYEKVYDAITHDQTWKDWMDVIYENPTDDPKLYADHGLCHAQRVVEYGRKFLTDYFYCQPYDYKKELGLFSIAAALHDIGYAKKNHEGHAKLSAEIADKYLEQFHDITAKERDVITHAIRHHSNGVDPDNILDAALILADKMDVVGYRYSNPKCNDDRKIGNMIREQHKVARVAFKFIEPLFSKNAEFKCYQTARLSYKLTPAMFEYNEPYNAKCLAEWPKALIVPRNIALGICKCKNFEFEVNDVLVDADAIIPR
ncbi:HD domain-containing protein [Candidatus Saccharibacteria bacterium]|nr:HD domain-containing protein [Candidatus Saccharibacteria bacterium]